MQQYQQIQGKNVKQRKPISLIAWEFLTTSSIILVYVPRIIAISNYTCKVELMMLTLFTLLILYTGLKYKFIPLGDVF